MTHIYRLLLSPTCIKLDFYWLQTGKVAEPGKEQR